MNSPTENPDETLQPEDALAVDATPDEERLHGDGDETDSVQRSDGAVVPVDDDANPQTGAP